MTVAMSDDAAGFWSEVPTVRPGTRAQRDWRQGFRQPPFLHGNKRTSFRAIKVKSILGDPTNTETKDDAGERIDLFEITFPPMHEMAFTCLTKDRDGTITFTVFGEMRLPDHGHAVPDS